MRVQANGALHIGSDSHHIRFQYGEINGDNNPSGIGMLISGSGPYLEVLYSRLHGAGGNSGKGCADPYGCYGAYYAGHHSLWEGNIIYNHGGYALNIYNSGHNDVGDNVVRNNVLYGNGFVDPRGQAGCGILLASGSNNVACHNVVYNNACGIQVDFTNGGSNNQVLYNTIVGNRYAGSHIGAAALGTIVQYNIVTGNGSAIENWGDPGLVESHNVLSDPGFVDAAAGNFALQSPNPTVGATAPRPVARGYRSSRRWRCHHGSKHPGTSAC